MKKLLILFLICSILFLTGCWDKRELSVITVITGMAIDKGENAKYRLSVEGINAGELNPKTAEGVAPSIVYSEEGETIAELAKKMNTGLSRHLIYSHMRVLIVGEDVARSGLIEFGDFLERNREIRDDFNFLVARDGKAEDILKVTYPFQKSSSMKLFTQLRTMSKEWGGDPDVRMNDIIDAWTSPGREPVMQVVKIKGNSKKGPSTDNMMSEDPAALVISDEMAVYKGAKLIGFLNLKEIRNYLWTQDELKQTSVVVPSENDKNLTIRVYDSNTKMKASLVHGKAKMHLKIHLIGYVDSTQFGLDLTKVATFEMMERIASKRIEKDIVGTVKKVQKKYGSDIFGFGEALYRQHPRDFKKVEKKWNDVFSDGDISAEVIVDLRRTGIRTKSFLDNLH